MKSLTSEKSIYLVMDPALGLEDCLNKVAQAIDGGIQYLQLWNNWLPGQDKHLFAEEICRIAIKKDVPVFINNDWEMLKSAHLAGVHFDAIPDDVEAIRATLNRPFVIGLTCGNDLTKVRWAIKNNVDYISFCSMFPSPSAGDCEIVSLETVKQARELTDIPIFLSGGITPTNVKTLLDSGLDGIAVISGIINAKDTVEATKMYKRSIQNNKVQ